MKYANPLTGVYGSLDDDQVLNMLEYMIKNAKNDQNEKDPELALLEFKKLVEDIVV